MVGVGGRWSIYSFITEQLKLRLAKIGLDISLDPRYFYMADDKPSPVSIFVVLFLYEKTKPILWW